MTPEEIKKDFEAKKAELEAQEAEALKRAKEKALKEANRKRIIDANAVAHAANLTSIFDKVESELIALGVPSTKILRENKRTPFGIECPASFITHVNDIEIQYRYHVEYKGVGSTYDRDIGTHGRVMWIITFEKHRPLYSRGRGSRTCRFKQHESGRFSTKKLAERMLEYANTSIAIRKATEESRIKEAAEQKFRDEIRAQYQIKKYTSEFVSFDSDKRINLKLRFNEETHGDFHELMAYLTEFYPHLVEKFLEKEVD